MGGSKAWKEPELPKQASAKVDFNTIGTATLKEKDDLKKVGIGPFIEKRLHVIGIYTFLQISKMTPKIEDEVNEVIQYSIGHVRRDEWQVHAAHFVKNAA